MTGLGALATEQFCYVTTTGRRTGNPHEIEIWFGLSDHTLYMLSGGGERSDWVRNIKQTPNVELRIGNKRFSGRGRIVSGGEEDALARRQLLEKYSPTYGGDLSEWGRTALPVAVDLSLD